MVVELITKEDLEKLKNELIQELTQLLTKNKVPAKTWLRSAEVRKMLSISTGTLQNLRINGTLPYSKIGGITYYKAEDIANLLGGNF